MELNEFQKGAERTAFYLGGNDMDPKVYCAIGLTEEAGEVAGKIKKLFRDHKGILDDERRRAIGNELGDTLYYLAMLASMCDLTLEDVARLNEEKRARRITNGTERGDGDER